MIYGSSEALSLSVDPLSISSFGGYSMSKTSFDNGVSSSKCLEMSTSLIFYMKNVNSENKLISEKKIKNNEKSDNLINIDSKRDMATLRTKRGEDIDIVNEVDKMKNLRCKWLKF